MLHQDEILVSCITPTLKSEKYLEGFLKDLENQDIFPNFEVILNMSSPTAKEVHIADIYKAKYGSLLQIVVHDEIQTLGPAWNQCISLSRADIIAVWNVDDLRTPNSLSSQIQSLQNNEHIVSYGPYEVTKEFENRSGRLIEEKNLKHNDFLRGMHFGPFMAFKKSALTQAGWFDEQLISGGDFDLSIRLALQGSAVRVANLLGYYLDEGMGASTSPNSKQLVERTVIELRYGIYDKIDWRYINQALKYDINNIYFMNQEKSVSDIPGASALIEHARIPNASYGKNFISRVREVAAGYLGRIK